MGCQIYRVDLTSSDKIVMTAVAHLDLGILETFRHAHAVTVLGVVKLGLLVRKDTPPDFGVDGLNQWIVHYVLHC